jgi:hypothetical protein
MKPTRQWGRTTTTIKIGKQETNQQAMRKQQPLNSNVAKEQYRPYSLKTTLQKKKERTKMYCNRHVKQCKDATAKSRPIGEWRRIEVQPLARKL